MDQYDSVIEYLYSQTPQFQQIGAAAYKPGLDTAYKLDEAFGCPSSKFKSVHIAGTNGKGSTAHTLAAILQSAGYKVGLYTSPHLVDFRERIRVDGQMISKDEVINFVNQYRKYSLSCSPSFFELTTIMAFDAFARHGVDVAVIETGLGGRLDTTNIINPLLSVITNISYDHVAQLGNTLEKIASEKAGIIKHGIPVIIGEAQNDNVANVFKAKAREVNAPITFACNNCYWNSVSISDDENIYRGTRYGDLRGVLSGECQVYNAATILAAIDALSACFKIDTDAVQAGFANVNTLTSLLGRWMTVAENPSVVCDTGHNVGGWQYLKTRLINANRPLSMVIGFVNDKDVESILNLMPRDAQYYFTQASIPRAMDACELARRAEAFRLNGVIISDVKTAAARAISETQATGTVFVGGSTFVVADFLSCIRDI